MAEKEKKNRGFRFQWIPFSNKQGQPGSHRTLAQCHIRAAIYARLPLDYVHQPATWRPRPRRRRGGGGGLHFLFFSSSACVVVVVEVNSRAKLGTTRWHRSE